MLDSAVSLWGHVVDFGLWRRVLGILEVCSLRVGKFGNAAMVHRIVGPVSSAHTLIATLFQRS